MSLGSDMKNLISCEKERILLVKTLHFSLHFIPMDPDLDPTESGSGSTPLEKQQ